MDRTPRKEKVEAVDEIKAVIDGAQSAVLTNYRGINVGAMTKLRKNMREAGIQYKVVKNTLARIAFNQKGITGLDAFLEGPTAIAFGMTDPVAPARVVMAFMKDVKNLEVKAGILDNKVITPEQVKALADLPSREVLLARVAGCFASPMTTLVSLFAAPLRNVAYGLEAIRKQKAESESAVAEVEVGATV